MNISKSLKLILTGGGCVIGALAASGGGHLPIYPRIMIGDQAIAYYRLNELAGSAVAADATTNQLQGMYHYSSAGAPPVGAVGLVTNSALFASGPGGASDYSYISLPATPLLSPANSDGVTGAPFSAECWVKPQTASPSDYASPLAVCGPAIGGASVNGSGWNFYETPVSPATWQLTMRTQSAMVDFASSSAITANQWSHLAVTFDGSSAVFYVNGIPQATNALTNYVSASAYSGAIGAGPETGHGAFSGGVAEVAFYNYALGLNQVSNHFAAGSAWLNANAQTVSTVSTPTTTGVTAP